MGAAGGGDGPGVGPAVGVEHGQGPQIPVLHPHRQVQERPHDVEGGVPVGDHHPFGPRRGPACVVDRQQIVLIDVRLGELVRCFA